METNLFWGTEYTIPAGRGFSQGCPGHLLWLLFGAALAGALCPAFRRWPAGGRRACRRAVAALLLADELFKYAVALHAGTFRLSYLPLHLCSINIFFIAADAWRPSLPLREVLFAVCLPGAFFALIFPGWASLPLWNALCIHSFTAHILLFLYPLLLLAEGFEPDFWRFLRVLPAMLAVVAGVYAFNQVFGTNFMFLSRAGEGNPLSWFRSLLGEPGYLAGIPLIAGACWVLLYGGSRAVGRLRRQRK